MKTQWCALIFLLLFSSCAKETPTPRKVKGDDVVKVLFIGNSHTYTHDVPKMVSRINDAQPNSPLIGYLAVANPGFTLEDHVRVGSAKQAIEREVWNYVVIQAASMEHIYGPEEQIANFRKIASAATVDEIPVLYGSWPQEPGDFYKNADTPPSAKASAEMIRHTNLATIEGTPARLAPMDETWIQMLTKHPEIRLYTDGNHTSVAGAYLAAAVVLRTLLQSPLTKENIWRPGGLSVAEAETLIDVANQADVAVNIKK